MDDDGILYMKINHHSCLRQQYSGSSMAGVEEELWNIFTFYTLHGNPLDLARLSVTHFLRLARDCQIINRAVTDIDRYVDAWGRAKAAHVPQEHYAVQKLEQAAVNLAFASVIQRRAQIISDNSRDCKIHKSRSSVTAASANKHATAGKSNLSYPEFLDALVVLGERLYSKKTVARKSRSNGWTTARGCGTAAVERDERCAGHSVEKTFQQLLMENVLPLASRRRPASVATAMRDPLVRDLLRHYGPALREMFRFYANSPSATVKKATTSADDDGGVATSGGETQQTTTTTLLAVDKKSDALTGTGDSEDETDTPPLPPQQQGPDPPVDGAAVEPPPPAETGDNDDDDDDAGYTPTAPPPAVAVDDESAANTTPKNGVVTGAAVEHASPHLLTSSKPVPDNDHIALDSSHDGKDGEVVPARGELCCVSGGDGGSVSGGIGGGGGGGGSDEAVVKERRHERRECCRPSSMVMNSMAGALSHRSLLCFTADFGVSGALLSGREVGEIFLSCGGGDCEQAEASKAADAGTSRTSLARAGKGGVRPLNFSEFLEALVRIALVCFRPRRSGISNAHDDEKGDEAVAPGHCLRALLAYMWRRLHTSVELVLNGAREGETRHRSSIQKGALLKGVQMFNERMLSRWRAEGFLDFAAATPVALPSVPGAPFLPPSYAHRQGNAVEILRKLLVLGETPAEKVEGCGGSLETIISEKAEEEGGDRQARAGDYEMREAGEGEGAPVDAAGRGRRSRGGRISVGIGRQVASRLRPDPLVV